MRRRLVAILVTALLGCDHRDDSSSPEAPPAPRAHSPEVEGGDPAGAADPPALAGDLAADIESFTTLDACVRRHARLDPLVGDALEAIGYDTLVSDSCRVLDAAKSRDARPCSAIAASPLRDHCNALVAEISGNADGCPWRLESRKELGRDPACVALASRDARLCSGVRDHVGRTRCVAVASRSPAVCNQLARAADRGDRERCEREVQRYGALVSTGQADSKADPSSASLGVSGRLTVTPGDGGPPVETDVAWELRDGLVVIEKLEGARFALGSLADPSAGSVSAAMPGQPTLGLEVFLPMSTPSSSGGGVRGAPRIEQVEVRMGAAEIRAPVAPAAWVANVTKFEPKRSGTVELTVTGDLEGRGGTRHVRADLTTFVRDVVTAEALYEIGPHRFGGGWEMR